MSDPIRIDIVSDIVCPWCAVGYHQLQKALAETDKSVILHWHPFELNPDMAPEGENLGHHLAAKYGTTPAQSREVRERITNLGAELGFTFNFFDEMRMLNTFRGHQLIHWAAEQGRETDMKLALFKAYFSDGQDINDLESLVMIAATLGLDQAEARQVLEDERYASEIRQAQTFWKDNGITSVPAFIFNQKYLVPGAVGVDQFKQILADLD